MYFWNIKKLSEELKAGTLSAGAQFWYMFLSTLILAFVFYVYPYIQQEEFYDDYDVMLDASSGSMMILSTIVAYWANNGRNGKDFILRLMSISWVLSVRWLVLIMIPTIIIVSLIFGGEGQPDNQDSLATMEEVIIYSITNLIYLIWIRKWMKVVSSGDFIKRSRTRLHGSRMNY